MLETRYKKGRLGHEMETTVTLEHIDYNKRRVLKFSTYKQGTGHIGTYVSSSIEENKEGYTTNTYALYEDYHKRFNVTQCKSVTEKAVRAAHEVTLQSAEDHIRAAKDFYKIP